MPVHERHGRLRVTRAQRLEDLLVLAERLGDAVGMGVHHGDAHPQLPVAELVVEAGEDLVPPTADDLGVEAAVGHRGTRQVPGGGLRLLLLQESLQTLDQPRRGRDRLADRVLLDQLPGLDDVRDLLRGDGQHQGALLGIELDQPLDLQPQQRLSHRRPGHADRLGQLALGEQRATLVTALQDTLFDVGVHTVGGGGCFTAGAGAVGMPTA